MAGLASFRRPATRAPLIRYFFAIVPRGETADVIDGIADRLREAAGLEAETIGRSRYHISLCGVAADGDAPAAPVGLLRQIGDRIQRRSRPFAVGFDHACSFMGRAPAAGAGAPRPLVLAHSDRLPALEALQAGLRDAMAAAGMPTSRQFNPHLTLLYDERPVPETGIAPLHWPVADFVLIRSVHGARRHDHLARWPLGGGQAVVTA
jgi:2'-5' RNA ligase